MKLPVRIYYEDTDCGGVVYYANYLRYFERGRTEFLRELGVSLSDMHANGTLFVVRKAEVEYLSPCYYNDLVHIDTQITGLTGATMTFSHSITRDGDPVELAKGTVLLACVGKEGRPARIPEDIKNALKPCIPALAQR